MKIIIMKYEKQYYSTRSLAILGYLISFCFTFFTIISCESEPDTFLDSSAGVDLNVSVFGTLSAIPREDATVTLYYTKNDAKKKRNPIKSISTGLSGQAHFYGLEVDRRYWVRVNSHVLRNIKRTKKLHYGTNQFTIRIL